MMRLGALLIAATVGASLAAATPWSWGSASSGASHDLRFDAVFKQATIVDAKPIGDSLGDVQVASGVLRHGGRKVGRFGFTCTWVGVSVQSTLERCGGWGMLKGEGQITVEGMSRRQSDDHTWAVTGGTGIYRHVSGQVKLHDRSDFESRVTIELSR